MTGLLPCPFCGKPGEEPVDGTRILGAWCLIHKCQVLGPIGIEADTREACIAIWSTRAAPAPWQMPPEAERPDDYLCLGLVHGVWRQVWWRRHAPSRRWLAHNYGWCTPSPSPRCLRRRAGNEAGCPVLRWMGNRMVWAATGCRPDRMAIVTAPGRIWLDTAMQPWRVWRLEMTDLPQYVRADRPPPLSAALALPEVRALVEAARRVHQTCWHSSDGITQEVLDLERALAALGDAE